jgi:hypothetical protein
MVFDRQAVAREGAGSLIHRDQDATPSVFADLGHGALDTAMVETAAFLPGQGPRLIFHLIRRSRDEYGFAQRRT